MIPIRRPITTRALMPACGVVIGAYPAIVGLISLITDRSMEGVAPTVFGLLLALVSIAEPIRRSRTARRGGANVSGAGDSEREEDEEEDANNAGSMVLPGIGLAALVVYVVVWSLIGYVIATLLLAVAIMKIAGWSYLKSTISSVLLAVGAYLIFVKLLAVPVPTGPVIDILSLN